MVTRRLMRMLFCVTFLMKHCWITSKQSNGDLPGSTPFLACSSVIVIQRLRLLFNFLIERCALPIFNCAHYTPILLVLCILLCKGRVDRSVAYYASTLLSTARPLSENWEGSFHCKMPKRWLTPFNVGRQVQPPQPPVLGIG